MPDIMPINVFHFDNNERNLGDFGHENDVLYWYASDLAKLLGCDNFGTFEKGPINRAVTALTALGIPIVGNITQVFDGSEGKIIN